MPELPEVETVVRDLRPVLVGQRIEAVRAGRKRLRKAWSKKWADRLAGCRFEAVRRRGKWIVAELDSGPLLIFHLGMTGQLTVRSTDDPVEGHTHLVFTLSDGTRQLRFRDIRRFGSVTLFDDPRAWETFLHNSKLGPEPFDMEPDYWMTAVRKTDRNLKAILLDQRVVAGVGNIYADESLFVARLDPRWKGKNLKRAEAERLRTAIVEVLNRAIAARGSTIRNYVGGSGLAGGYQERFYVYGRTGEPCRTCETPVERIRLAGRSTHYCPRCQK
jgi:formamidopyrimidine-DNA glycosylase